MVKDAQRHFSRIANRYTHLRTTDDAPIAFIESWLKTHPVSVIAEIGCGDGRYTARLLQSTQGDPFLYCVDKNKAMLSLLSKNLKKGGFKNFKIIQASAERLPFESNSIDALFVFNAIHHFQSSRFLDECSRCLGNHGRIFIYTRFKNQNSKNIWGKYFPLFQKKETRLLTLNSFRSTMKKAPGLLIEHIEYFRFPRVENINRLKEQTQGKHYSTFNLYTETEFKRSLKTFIDKLQKRFHDVNRISWHDENTLIILKKNPTDPL